MSKIDTWRNKKDAFATLCSYTDFHAEISSTKIVVKLKPENRPECTLTAGAMVMVPTELKSYFAQSIEQLSQEIVNQAIINARKDLENARIQAIEELIEILENSKEDPS